MTQIDTTSPEFIAAVAAAAEAKAKEIIEAQLSPEGAMAKAIAEFKAKHEAETAERIAALDAKIAALSGRPPPKQDDPKGDDKGGTPKREPWQLDVLEMSDFEAYRRARREADAAGRDIEVLRDGQPIVRMERQPDQTAKVRVLSAADARDPVKYQAARLEADKAGEELTIEGVANG